MKRGWWQLWGVVLLVALSLGVAGRVLAQRSGEVNCHAAGLCGRAPLAPVSVGIGGVPSAGALQGSLGAALALRRVDPADPNGDMAQVLVLTPSDGGVSVSTLEPQPEYAHLLGWVGDSALLVLRRAGDGSLAAIRHDPVSGAAEQVASGLDPARAYALSPDGSRVVAWPRSVQGAAPFADLQIYEAAAMALLDTVDLSALGLLGPQLAGWSGSSVYFFARQPADAFLAVNLEGGAVSGPLDLLAAGDGNELVRQASLVEGSALAVVGRVNPKDANGVYSVPLPGPDRWPSTTAAEPRPVAQATPHPFPGIGEAQGVFWGQDGRVAAIVAATPGDFSASNVYLTDPAFTATTTVELRAAFDSCVAFTPDGGWLLYVGPAGDSLLALPTTDLTASPEVLLSGQPGLSLCQAGWQPSGAGTTISGSQGGQGGVTLGGGEQPAPLSVGATATGAITDADFAVDYALTLEAGQVVTVTMQRTGGNLDPFLLLLGPEGQELASNDDAEVQVGDTPLNAQIAGFVAPAAGTYTIRATRYLQESGGSTGPFQLAVESGAAAPTPGGPGPVTGDGVQDGGMVALGDTVTGAITESVHTVSYTVSLAAGQPVTVTMQRQGGNLDSLLILYGPDGAELARNDDAEPRVGDSGLNAQVAGFVPPSAGVYTIHATRFMQAEGLSTGPFTLSLESGGPVVVASPTPTQPLLAEGVADGGSLALNQTASGEIGGAVHTVEYTIDLRAGETIAITMQRLSGDLDCFLIVFGPQGNVQAFNDDSAVPVGDTSLNAHIPGYTAPADGTYYIQATRYQFDEGRSAGRFQLTVGPGTPMDVGSGGQVSVGATVTGEITATTYAVDYTITLQAGDSITVTMQRIDDTLDPYISILDSAGNEIVFNDDADVQVGDSELNAQIVGFVVPRDGVYTIRATRYLQMGGPSTGRYQLSVMGAGSTK